MGHFHEIADELRTPARELRHAIPDTMGAFVALHRAAMGDGALPRKVKELIALSIAVVERCDGCVSAHARGAASAGATEAEVAEAMGVAVLMNGGPATVWGPRALAAFKEYADPPPGPEPDPQPTTPAAQSPGTTRIFGSVTGPYGKA